MAGRFADRVNAMSYNLANLPFDERNAQEDEKATMFAFWQQNLEKAKAEAGRIWGEKGKRKGQWASWAHDQIAGLEPAQYQSMVRRELERLG